MHFGRSAFLITKPLQLMIALCISKQEKFETKPIFVIIDAFAGAAEVAQKLSFEFIGLQTPKYFESRKNALTFIKEYGCNNLFIDSDVGFKNYLTLASLKFNSSRILIHVYEEGLGTYRMDLYSGVRKMLLRLIGVGVFFGTCCFVSNIYVYCAKEYINKIPKNEFEVHEIKERLQQFLVDNCIAFNRLFGFSGVKPASTEISCCSVYLSGWKMDGDFLSYFQGLEGDLYMKPHPHNRDANFPLKGIKSIDAQVPAEVLLMDLIEKYRRVSVYDCNSSVRRYIGSDNLNFSLVSFPPNLCGSFES